MNASSNAASLARRAGVPCPELISDDFVFVIWDDGSRWGHIDVTRGRVTVWNPAGWHNLVPLDQ